MSMIMFLFNISTLRKERFISLKKYQLARLCYPNFGLSSCYLSKYIFRPSSYSRGGHLDIIGLYYRKNTKQAYRMERKVVSNVGKLQLLMTSLQGISIYFLSLVKIYNFMVENMEMIQSNFLWNGMEEKDRIILVNQDTFYKWDGGES